MTRSGGSPQIGYCYRRPLSSPTPSRSAARRLLGSPERPRVQAKGRGIPQTPHGCCGILSKTPQEDWMCSKTRHSPCYASEMEVELRPRCGGTHICWRQVATNTDTSAPLGVPPGPALRVLSHPDPAPSPGQFPSSWCSQGAEYSPPSTLKTQTWRQVIRVCRGEDGRGPEPPGDPGEA